MLRSAASRPLYLLSGVGERHLFLSFRAGNITLLGRWGPLRGGGPVGSGKLRAFSGEVLDIDFLVDRSVSTLTQEVISREKRI